MPAASSATLDLLRSSGQATEQYLIIQQPMYRKYDEWAGYIWSCQINGAPAGTEGDMIATFTVDNGSAGPIGVLDGSTLLVGSVKGGWDRGIFRARGDQATGAATVTLNIGASAEVVGIVQNDDWVVALDEFRVWRRDPRITEAGGVLTWYKDFDLLYENLDPPPLGTAAHRREASLPAVPIMGPSAVRFIDPGRNARVYFDWSNSYATYPGATVNAWNSWGEDGGAGWNSVVQVPGWQTYTNVSGLGGYFVRMEVGTDAHDPPTWYRCGIRWVFTLRRPGQTQPGDPPNAEPITNFQIQSMSGTFSQGSWHATIRIPGETAHEYMILPGALVILFSENWYGGAKKNIGPLSDREEIGMIGHITDGSITQDSESGDVIFEVMSAAELAQKREQFPIVIESDSLATEWYQTPSLTIDRAVWHYAIWHSTIPKVCDFYVTGNSFEILAHDFLAGTLYQSMDSFLNDRLVARLLCDRFERFKCDIDLQMGVAGAGTTLFTLQGTDWSGAVRLQERVETPVASVDMGGVLYDAGAATPYMSRAPGDTSKQQGNNFQTTHLAVDTQATLNTWSGRMLAYKNSRFPVLALNHPGHWPIFDIWPQEYINVGPLYTERHTFSNDLFIVREIMLDHDPVSGSMITTTSSELETDGVAGKTIPIEGSIPPYEPPERPDIPPYYPPEPGGGGVIDEGRRIFATDVGIFVTDDIGDTLPYYYAVNQGLPVAQLRCWKILRDPWHWWTSGGTERTLWGIFNRAGGWYAGVGGTGLPFYLYKHEMFPIGNWVLSYSASDLGGGLGHWQLPDMVGSIETEDLWYLSVHQHTGGLDGGPLWAVRSTDGGGVWTTRGQYCTGAAGDWVGYCGWYSNIDSHGMNRVGTIDLAKHTAGLQVDGYYIQRPPFAARVMQSNDGGSTFNVLGAPNGAGANEPNAGITVPYVDAAWSDTDILIRWERTGIHGIQRSINSGLTWSSISDAGANYRALFGGICPSDRNTIAFVCNATVGAGSKIIITHDGGLTWTIWKTMAYLCGPGGFIKWVGVNIDTILLFWKAPQSGRSVRLLTSTQDVDRTGNLFSVGAVTDVSRIERDSMGAA